MTSLTQSEVQSYFSSRLPGIKQAGAEWRGKCPIHNGTRESFSVDPETGRWFCHSECGRGGDVFDLEQILGGVDFKAAKENVMSITGLEDPEVPAGYRTVAKYDYTDERGALLFQVHRRENGSSQNKKFSQCQLDHNGNQVWNLKGVRLVPFHLPGVLESQSVIIVEGEKSALAAESLGFAASCNPMGAGKWKSEYSYYFAGKHIAILPDNDEPGKKHADQVAKSIKGIAASVRIVNLPNLPQKGDIVEWIAAGGSRDSLLDIIKSQPVIKDEPQKDIRNDEIPPEAAVNKTAKKPIQLPETTNGGDLLMTDYPPPVFLFDGLLHNGVTLLCGRPKMGKSWLALQLALDASMGRSGLGRYPCDTANGVLYIALEEGKSRTANRILKFVKRSKINQALVGNIDFWYELEPLLKKGVEQIEAQLETKQYGLIVIDTFLAALRQSSGRQDNAMQEDYKAVKTLQAVAQRFNTCILLIHHTRKMTADYSLDRVAGTTGLTAAADSVWVLDRQSNATILSIQGRDMADAELAMKMEQKDEQNFGWSVTGTGEETKVSASQSEIMDLLRESGKPMMPLDIAHELKRSRSYVRKLLMAMRSAGMVSKTDEGYRPT